MRIPSEHPVSPAPVACPGALSVAESARRRALGLLAPELRFCGYAWDREDAAGAVLGLFSAHRDPALSFPAERGLGGVFRRRTESVLCADGCALRIWADAEALGRADANFNPHLVDWANEGCLVAECCGAHYPRNADGSLAAEYAESHDEPYEGPCVTASSFGGAACGAHDLSWRDGPFLDAWDYFSGAADRWPATPSQDARLVAVPGGGFDYADGSTFVVAARGFGVPARALEEALEILAR